MTLRENRVYKRRLPHAVHLGFLLGAPFPQMQKKRWPEKSRKETRENKRHNHVVTERDKEKTARQTHWAPSPQRAQFFLPAFTKRGGLSSPSKQKKTNRCLRHICEDALFQATVCKRRRFASRAPSCDPDKVWQGLSRHLNAESVSIVPYSVWRSGNDSLLTFKAHISTLTYMWFAPRHCGGNNAFMYLWDVKTCISGLFYLLTCGDASIWCVRHVHELGHDDDMEVSVVVAGKIMCSNSSTRLQKVWWVHVFAKSTSKPQHASQEIWNLTRYQLTKLGSNAPIHWKSASERLPDSTSTSESRSKKVHVQIERSVRMSSPLKLWRQLCEHFFSKRETTTYMINVPLGGMPRWPHINIAAHNASKPSTHTTDEMKWDEAQDGPPDECSSVKKKPSSTLTDQTNKKTAKDTNWQKKTSQMFQLWHV